MTALLIDADAIVYRVGFACEKDGSLEPLENCLYSVSSQIFAMCNALNTGEFRLFISGDNNFRKDVATIKPYKGNRDSNHRPIYYNEIREYLIREWGATVVHNMEADDALSIAQLYNEDTIICSIDKDLDQVVGWHYNFVKQELYCIDEETAIRNLYIQILTGDSTDNIQGIPGVGPKTAANILAGCKSEEDYYDAVRSAYLEAYMCRPLEEVENILNENASLVYLLKHKEDKWKPPC